jgi:predicted O-methyltransferase YrrM
MIAVTGRLRTLARLAHENPSEAWDRIRTAAAGRLGPRFERPGNYVPLSAEMAPALLRSVDIDIAPYVDEPALLEIESHVVTMIPTLKSFGPFNVSHNADFALARLGYLLTRATHPNVILETGVGYGVSTAFFLVALRENGGGTLHSIDLPPLKGRADDFVGHAVPPHVRDIWTLHRGSVRRVLPRVLREIGEVDLFMHDSLHTRRHMIWELREVKPFLSQRAVVVADDIGGNTAFSDWAPSARARLYFALDEPTKGGLAGVAVL